MAETLKPVLFLSLIISLFFSISAQTCRNQVFSNNRQFSSCNDLPVLNSFLHWNYNPLTGTVDIAYRHTNIDSSRWIAWAINQNGAGMVGCEALVAFQGTNGMRAYTSPIPTYSTQLTPGNLSFEVSDITARFERNEMTIYATIQLPNNKTTVNQVWQEGPLTNGNPARHDLANANLISKGTLDFLSGESSTSSVDSRTKRKNVHGVLNAVAWGILMPTGAIIARYLKVFKSMDPTWFYLHIGTQTSAYIIGVAGWATGIKLGSDSSGIQYNPHRNIGIVLFILATLQVFALLLRPKPDHKYRFYWAIYHQLTGYVVIVLSIVNIFKGFDILEPEKKWKRIFIGAIVGLGIAAVQLEALTWYLVFKRKRAEKSHGVANGHANGNGNVYGARPQSVV